MSKSVKGFKVEKGILKRYYETKSDLGINSDELMFAHLIELAEKEVEIRFSEVHMKVQESKIEEKILKPKPTSHPAVTDQEMNNEDRLAMEIFQKAMTGEKPFNSLPCPHNFRKMDTYFQCFYCVKDMSPPFTERRIRYRQIHRIAQCQQCIETHKAQKKINEKVAQEKYLKSSAVDYRGRPLTKIWRGY